MKEYPILFSGPMVRAILEGKKTQTRRVAKFPEWVHSVDCHDGIVQIWNEDKTGMNFRNCYKKGDRLWVRETWGMVSPESLGDEWYRLHEAKRPLRLHPDSNEEDGVAAAIWHSDGEFPCKWKPSIHMPRWASRITLEVVSVRAERLQQISEADASAEGASCCLWYKPFGKEEVDSINLSGDAINPVHPTHGGERGISYRNGFATLWDSINCKRGYGWDKNPFVWVIEFKKV